MDHRSDIFSFGAVLYEMLSGQRAFQGDSGVEVLNAILQGGATATWRRRAAGFPRRSTRVVRRCLEKRPEDRFQLGAGPGLRRWRRLAPTSCVGRRRRRSPPPRRSGRRTRVWLAFTEADAEHFFGREAEVEALWDEAATATGSWG